MTLEPLLARGPARFDTRRQLHSLTGLVPLSAYFVFHLWEQWPARISREALLERLSNHSWPFLELVFVLFPIATHAALGLTLPPDPEADRLYASPAFRGLQRASGIVVGAFLAFHVVTVWWPGVYQRGGASAALAALLDGVGTMAGAGLYLLGLSAAAVHFGQGLSVAWLRTSARSSPRFVRAACALFAAVLWLMMLDVLSAHVAGAPLL